MKPPAPVTPTVRGDRRPARPILPERRSTVGDRRAQPGSPTRRTRSHPEPADRVGSPQPQLIRRHRLDDVIAHQRGQLVEVVALERIEVPGKQRLLGVVHRVERVTLVQVSVGEGRPGARRPTSRDQDPWAARGAAAHAADRNRRSSRSGTARTAATTDLRTVRDSATPGPSSPGQHPRLRAPIRACGSSGRSARGGAARAHPAGRRSDRSQRSSSNARSFMCRCGATTSYAVLLHPPRGSSERRASRASTTHSLSAARSKPRP